MKPPSGEQLVHRAQDLRSAVVAHADRAEEERRLPDELATQLAAAGLHRIAAPPAYDGSDASPRHQVEAIEAIASADGAAGWTLMIGIENMALMAMQWPAGAELLSDPTTIVCGSTAAVGRADAVDGGWRISGRWGWASGCHNADWFGGLVNVFRPDRGEEPVNPRPVYAFAPRGSFEILDTWHTAGMRGSGSHDVAIDGLVVPDAQVAFYDKAWVRAQRRESVLARIPLGVRLAHNKAAVALGIGRAAIDEFTALATEKVPAMGSQHLRDRSFAQAALADATSWVHSSRAWVLETCDRMWDKASARSAFTPDDKALAIMACSDAVARCVDAVEAVCTAAGTTPNMTGQPLDRIRRNATVVRSHVTVAPHLRVEAAARLLGLDTPSFLFDLP